MSARLSSLLVAGGVLLTGVHPGVLKAAPAAEASPRKATLVSASLESEGTGARVLLRISGLAAKPGLQVLPQPNRVVLDLPGVARGTAVSREDLAQLTHPLILKARLAQFKEDPTPVTRLVLEVAPGTQVLVGVVPEGHPAGPDPRRRSRAGPSGCCFGHSRCCPGAGCSHPARGSGAPPARSGSGPGGG